MSLYGRITQPGRTTPLTHTIASGLSSVGVSVPIHAEGGIVASSLLIDGTNPCGLSYTKVFATFDAGKSALRLADVPLGRAFGLAITGSAILPSVPAVTLSGVSPAVAVADQDAVTGFTGNHGSIQAIAGVSLRVTTPFDAGCKLHSFCALSPEGVAYAFGMDFEGTALDGLLSVAVPLPPTCSPIMGFTWGVIVSTPDNEPPKQGVFSSSMLLSSYTP
jgi:hypothetical protein